MNNISLSRINSDLNLIETNIAKGYSRNITCIEYRGEPSNEEWDVLFLIPKKEVSDELEAFVALITYEIYFEEQWDILKAKPEVASPTLHRFLLPKVEKYLFTDLSVSDVKKYLNPTIRKMTDFLSKLDSSGNVREDDRFGVFVNNKRVDSEESLFSYGFTDIISSLALGLEWDFTEIMYQTEDNYVLYFYGTTG